MVFLFLFCHERDFIASLSYDKEAEIIQAFNSTRRYINNKLNIDNSYFDDIVGRIYPHGLQLNKAYASDTAVPFLKLYLSFSNGFISSKFIISAKTLILTVNFLFLNGDLPRSASLRIYISQLIRYIECLVNVTDMTLLPVIESLTTKLLQEGYRYYTLRKTS